MNPTAVCGVIGELTDATRAQLEQLVATAHQDSIHQSSIHQDRPQLERVASAASFEVWATAGSTAVQVADELQLVAWSQAGAPSVLDSDWQQTARADASGITATARQTILHSSVSGAQPLYVREQQSALFFSTRLTWLLTGIPGELTPDPQSWGQILSFGAPLAGRTTTTSAHRAQPMEYWVHTQGSNAVTSHQAAWPWEQVLPDPQLHQAEATEETLRRIQAQVRPTVEADGRAIPVNPMLSGGRDSRLLTAVAAQLSPDASQLLSWTTSSDTGTAMEELVAARTAALLDVRQSIIAPRFSRFAQDFTDYASAVDHQASYHVWLTPVAQALASRTGTILDGLGGGVFLGGGFGDPQQAAGAGPEQILQLRLARMTRYLDGAELVLNPDTVETISEAGRDDFTQVAARFTDHPNGHTLSAYLTRTLPGISLAPAAVLASAQPVAMPLISDSVVSLALSLDPSAKVEGSWYPHLLAAADSRLAGVPTAADLTRHRHHIRRGAGIQAVQFYKQQLLETSVAELLAPELRDASDAVWARLLNNTKHQHLLRGLGMLSLWLQQYSDRLTVSSARQVLHG